MKAECPKEWGRGRGTVMGKYGIGGRYWELGGEEQWKMGRIPNGDGNDMGNG